MPLPLAAQNTAIPVQMGQLEGVRHFYKLDTVFARPLKVYGLGKIVTDTADGA